eukprot:5331682-Prymnesium_polylepis.2
MTVEPTGQIRYPPPPRSCGAGLEPWPNVIQTSARRLPDAGQTRSDVFQTSSRRLPDAARRPTCPYHVRTTSRH